jgi:hypothetical protein
VPVGPTTNPGRTGGVPIGKATRGKGDANTEAAESGLSRAPGLVGNEGLAKAGTKAGFAVPVGPSTNARSDVSN